MTTLSGSLPVHRRRTACFSVIAAAEPGAMPRVLEIFAKRGLVPSQWLSSIAGFHSRELHIDIQLEGVDTPGTGRPRTKVETAATKVNKDAERESVERVRQAELDQRTGAAKIQRLNVELDTLQGYLSSGLGLPTDSSEATEQRARTKEQILKVNEELLTLGAGISRTILERGFEIALNASLATKQNAQTKITTQKQLDISAAKREQAVKVRDQQLPVQVARFAAVHGEKIIDAGLAEGLSPKAMVDRLFMLHNDADMSNPKARGFGLMRAMAQNEGQDSELLNKVQSKLGPFGMATLDAMVMTIEGYGDQLGEPASPEIGAYRDEVLSRASSRLVMGHQNRAYSAIQLG
ncbi:MAG: hypothetical protein IH994_12495, partial [Proteobacteria bacterium]|nr:hypothetical protein [Pseudomonadota bacterium]